MRHLFLGTLLAAALPLLACGDISADEFLTQYPAGYCAYHLYCCTSDEQSYNSSAACQLRVKAELEDLLAFRTSATPGATFDGATAQACLDRLAAKTCNDASLVKGCAEDAVKPQQSQGQPCSSSAECMTYFCDTTSATGGQGVCGGQGVVGAKCSGDDRACPPGSFCSGLGICTDLKQAGDRCTSPGDCQSYICHRSQKLCANASRTPICQGK